MRSSFEVEKVKNSVQLKIAIRYLREEGGKQKDVFI